MSYCRSDVLLWRQCGWRIHSRCFTAPQMMAGKLLNCSNMIAFDRMSITFEHIFFFLAPRWVCGIATSLLDSWGFLCPSFPCFAFLSCTSEPLHHWLTREKKGEKTLQWISLTGQNRPSSTTFPLLCLGCVFSWFLVSESYYNLATISNDQGQLRQWLQVMSILHFQTS